MILSFEQFQLTESQLLKLKNADIWTDSKAAEELKAFLSHPGVLKTDVNLLNKYGILLTKDNITISVELKKYIPKLLKDIRKEDDKELETHLTDIFDLLDKSDKELFLETLIRFTAFTKKEKVKDKLRELLTKLKTPAAPAGEAPVM